MDIGHRKLDNLTCKATSNFSKSKDNEKRFDSIKKTLESR